MDLGMPDSGRTEAPRRIAKRRRVMLSCSRISGSVAFSSYSSLSKMSVSASRFRDTQTLEWHQNPSGKHELDRPSSQPSSRPYKRSLCRPAGGCDKTQIHRRCAPSTYQPNVEAIPSIIYPSSLSFFPPPPRLYQALLTCQQPRYLRIPFLLSFIPRARR
jgi:hypothetical protein